ncbi:hypothetical protein [Streptomonospora wellingtoniae]|uniref:CDP-alcohol phosphatidyltransferase family protein n=1 Tax=Streptomonospora wellingtoniae TaxID=3075544 RepID=A0ABU2KZ35_9ACTN|nr:hypothetical protein [Streptomonospora sp. DSM 45055]MDT0304565.1 hypothetical protein [Streptomonospora sp. DSM 45055]
MTRIGLVLAVTAGVWFTEGGVRGAVAGSLLLGAVVLTDVLAGRVRAARRDRLDVWLALVLGRLREYAVYAGLAIGGTAAGVADAWAWAAGALIAVALRDSVAAARRADAGEPEWTPESGLPRPIEAVDPSRDLEDASPGDTSLTAELLGREAPAAHGTDGTGEPDAAPGDVGDGGTASEAPAATGGGAALFGIRTVPKGAPWPGWAEVRSEALGEGAPGSAAPPGAAEGTPGTGGADERDPAAGGAGAPRRGSGPPRALLARLAAFPQAARFAAVALTITIWDARVTFIALIAGCALAAAADLARRPDDDVGR